MRALVWEQNVTLKEIPVPPIPKGWVLGKILYAMFGPIDRSIMLGLHPVEPNRVAGSLGVIRVIEPGIEVSDIRPGEVYAVIPYCQGGIVGIDYDGLLADYAAVPHECLIKVSRDDLRPELPLWIEFSFLDDLSRIVDGKKTLIVGCGFSGYVTARYLKDKCDVTVACIERALYDDIASLGIEVMMFDNISSKYDVIVVEPLSIYSTLQVLKALNEYGTLVFPPTQPKVLLSYSGFPRVFHILRPQLGNIAIGKKALEGIPDKLRKNACAILKHLDEVPVLVRYYGRVVYVAEKETEKQK
ncbi:MAG: hypothetical protein J7L51_04270 [Desulfurococcales archaeon]|nr:hypothetical protein [Desulfurococcales archaeon]